MASDSFTDVKTRDIIYEILYLLDLNCSIATQSYIGDVNLYTETLYWLYTPLQKSKFNGLQVRATQK